MTLSIRTIKEQRAFAEGFNSALLLIEKDLERSPQKAIKNAKTLHKLLVSIVDHEEKENAEEPKITGGIVPEDPQEP